MKKHKVKKLVAKIFGEELAKYDSRIYDLEVNFGVKETQFDPSSEYINNLAIKDAEYIKESRTEVAPGVFVSKGTDVVTKEQIGNSEQEEIDWSVPQKVIHGDLLIQTTGQHYPEDSGFSGVALTTTIHHKEGDFRDNWNKENFKPFKGNLTLKNDN